MRLAFREDEERAFFDTRDRLLDLFAVTGAVDENCRFDVELALDWKWGYGDADLGSWTSREVREFLIEWCPRKVSMPAEKARSLAASLSSFLNFLAQEGLLAPGSTPVGRLQAELAGMGDEVVAAMGDRTRFGMAKSLFAGMADLGIAAEMADSESLNAAMERFNALPFDVRGEILGLPRVAHDPWRQITDGIELPPAPPRPAEIDSLAGSAPVVDRFRRLREFLGDGRKLTAKGNLTVADAKAVAAILDDPGLAAHEEHGWAIRSAADLPQTQFLLRWARAAGAVRVAKGRMAATASWAKLESVGQVARAAAALLDKGPIELQTCDNQWAPRALIEVLDEGAVHLLAVLWALPDGFEFEDLLDGVVGACEMQLSFSPVLGLEARHRQIRLETDALFDALALAGIVEREGDVSREDEFGIARRSGGQLTLTPVGRAFLAPYLDAHGYRVPVTGALAEEPLAALFEQISGWPPERTRAEFDHWVRCHSASEAIEQMAALLESYSDPQWPIAAMDLAGRLPAPDDERAVLRFCDTAARGHAIGWLMDHGCPDIEIDGPAMLRAGVEMMSLQAHGDADEEFADLVSAIDDLNSFIDDVWRVPIPESTVVLEAIGRVHPDKTIAKAARKAAFKQRSLAANRNRPV